MRLSTSLCLLTLASAIVLSEQAKTPAPSPKGYFLETGRGEPICEAYLKRLQTRYPKKVPSPCDEFDRGIPGVTLPEWEEIPFEEHEDYHYATAVGPEYANEGGILLDESENTLRLPFLLEAYPYNACWERYKQRQIYLYGYPRFLRSKIRFSENAPLTEVVQYIPHDAKWCQKSIRLFQEKKTFDILKRNNQYFLFNPEHHTLEPIDAANRIVYFNKAAYFVWLTDTPSLGILIHKFSYPEGSYYHNKNISTKDLVCAITYSDDMEYVKTNKALLHDKKDGRDNSYYGTSHYNNIPVCRP